jgi:hypothetical protein
MKLKSVVIDGFRSVKDRIPLFTNPRISILIGANDHGKTTLLEAIRCLNDDRPISPEDENWDSVGKGKPILEYKFELDPEELTELSAIGARFQKEQSEKESVSDAEGATETEEATPNGASPKQAPLVELPAVPTIIEFNKSGIGGALTLKSEPFGDLVVEAGSYLRKCVPRVELFKPVDQIMDAVTLAELDDPNQEFMQGVFRYAGIWDAHEKLFRQDPATTRRLERASADFTRKIHEEWKQGENLAFKFRSSMQGKMAIKLSC